MRPQVTLQVTMSARNGILTAEILVDPETLLGDLFGQCAHAVTLQHPHYADHPIISVRADARENMGEM